MPRNVKCLHLYSAGRYDFPVFKFFIAFIKLNAIFDFFTQYPDMNKRSLIKLKNIVRDRHIKYVCTGHSGIRTDIEKAFSHIDKSATFSKKHPFDENAPWDFTDDNL